MELELSCKWWKWKYWLGWNEDILIQIFIMRV